MGVGGGVSGGAGTGVGVGTAVGAPVGITVGGAALATDGVGSAPGVCCAGVEPCSTASLSGVVEQAMEYAAITKSTSDIFCKRSIF